MVRHQLVCCWLGGSVTPVASTSSGAPVGTGSSSRGDLGTNISSVATGSSSRGDLGAGPGPCLYNLEREPQWSFEECRGGAQSQHGDIAFRAHQPLAWLRK